MNITEYAKRMGTSKTTLYRKLSEAGIDVSTLRDADGQISDDGLSILSSLLDGTLQRRKVSQQVDAPTDGANLAGKVADLERQLNETRAALDAANARIAVLQQQAAERAERHADELRDILKRQQEIDAQRLLTDGSRRGILGRLHDRLFGTKQAQQPTQTPTDSDQI